MHKYIVTAVFDQLCSLKYTILHMHNKFQRLPYLISDWVVSMGGLLHWNRFVV